MLLNMESMYISDMFTLEASITIAADDILIDFIFQTE